MSNGGEVKARISLDNKGFLKSVKEVTSSLSGVKNTASTVLKGIGNVTGTAFKVVGGAVAGATGAFAGLVTASVKARGEIEQSFGGIEALFGKEEDLINQVKDTGQKAYKDMQMSASDYYNNFLSAYSLINVSLNDEQKSIKQTNRLLQLEADLMNTYGGTTEQYATAINWALKGSYSYLDNLNIGITGTASGFLEAAESCGYLVGHVNELTAEQKIDIIEQYAKKVGVIGRSAEESSKTIQGSIKTLGASWNNFLSGAGDFGSVVDSASVAMGNIIKIVEEAIPSIVNGITSNLPALLNLVQKIIEEVGSVLTKNLPMITNTVMQLLSVIVNIITSNMPLLTSTIVTLIGEIMKIIEVVLPQIIDAITNNLPALLELMKTIIIRVAKTLLDNFDTILNTVLDVFMEIVALVADHAPEIVDAIVKIIFIVADAIANNIQPLIMAIYKIGTAIILKLLDPDFQKGIVDAVFDIGKNMILGLWNGISYYLGTLWEKLKAGLSNLVSKAKAFLGIRSPSTVFASMGKNMALGIGEGFNDEIQGVFDDMKPELSVGIDKVNNAVQGAGVVGGTKTQNNTFNINNGLDMGVAMQELNWLYRRM